ncbi:hypothetical protein B0H65DRAFT_567359 [Neurospora tetraspora]|uniref:Uncharacterized protein n=1 Tax=Neurospora tetraspora TaxID=94610 RepID=A0AAE0JJA1_9PEZI|nr:hypothetical protein B0H65DRAFT_567359 [Neurospora tetraspora]
MAAITSHINSSRNFSRSRVPALKVKTTLGDPVGSDGKGKALASDDWRKHASAPGISNKGNLRKKIAQRSSATEHSMEMPREPGFYRPNDGQTA